ncbi:hypothetical protein DIMARIA_39 [Mycobacterium phage DiMaria]
MKRVRELVLIRMLDHEVRLEHPIQIVRGWFGRKKPAPKPVIRLWDSDFNYIGTLDELTTWPVIFLPVDWTLIRGGDE